MNRIINTTLTLFDSIAAKVSDALSSLCGWLLGMAIVVANFFAGYNLVFCGIITAVTFDVVFGVWVAVKQKKFILSELLRATFFKLMVYLNLLVVFVFIDKFADAGGIETKITTMLVASLICLAEVWSSSANALIIKPDFPFLRLFRKALTGEMARKLGCEPKDVERYLNRKK